jgi:hypothetical protein
MNAITPCIQTTRQNDHDAIVLVGKIKHNTTSQEFNALRRNNRQYKLEDGGYCGWTALGAAAYKSNYPLVRHIIQIGNKDLLERGNQAGWTPLFSAAIGSENMEDSYLIAKELIRLGANPNIATIFWRDTNTQGEIPEDVTALWAAAEKTKNLKLVKLLLLYGAIIPPQLSSEGAQIISTAQEEIKQERLEKEKLFLMNYFKRRDDAIPLHILCPDVVRKIYDILVQDRNLPPPLEPDQIELDQTENFAPAYLVNLLKGMCYGLLLLVVPLLLTYHKKNNN